jgi:hypothetical protein
VIKPACPTEAFPSWSDTPVQSLVEHGGLSTARTGVFDQLMLAVIGLQASKFHTFPFYPMFSQEKKPLHMVNQKHRYSQFMPPVSQSLILT